MKEYIEREAVINDIGELFTICHETLPNECGHHFIVENELKTHLNFVKNLPAADVREVVRAKWIEFPAALAYKDAYCDTHIVCSACEAVFDIMDNCTETFNNCPNCGAEMRPEPPKEET